jgi:hypothetical protein
MESLELGPLDFLLALLVLGALALALAWNERRRRAKGEIIDDE